jgi:hypothetical protein
LRAADHLPPALRDDLLSVEETLEALKKALAIKYRPPGDKG